MRSAHAVLLGIQLADDDRLEGWMDGWIFVFPAFFGLGMDVFSMTGGNGGWAMGGDWCIIWWAGGLHVCTNEIP